MLHAESATLCVTGRKARAMHRSTSIVRAFPRCTGALVFMLVLRRSYTVHAASRRESAVSSHEGSDWVLTSACAVLKAACAALVKGSDWALTAACAVLNMPLARFSKPLARFSTCRLRGSQHAACAVLNMPLARFSLAACAVLNRVAGGPRATGCARASSIERPG